MDAPHVPMRRCLGCGGRAPKAELVRFVAVPGPTGRRLERDDRGRLPGRGLYVCDHRRCFTRALDRRAFHRGARLDGERLEVDRALADALQAGGTVTHGHD